MRSSVALIKRLTLLGAKEPKTALGQAALDAAEHIQNSCCGDRMYIVLAFRYGTFDNVFPIGVFTTRQQAVAAALEHRQSRGGKYDHRIYTFAEPNYLDAEVGHRVNDSRCLEWVPGFEPHVKSANDSHDLLKTLVARQADEILRLRLSQAERDAIEYVCECGFVAGPEDIKCLRNLLDRLQSGENNVEQQEQQ